MDYKVLKEKVLETCKGNSEMEKNFISYMQFVEAEMNKMKQ